MNNIIYKNKMNRMKYKKFKNKVKVNNQLIVKIMNLLYKLLRKNLINFNQSIMIN